MLRLFTGTPGEYQGTGCGQWEVVVTHHVKQMLETHPWPGRVSRDILARCIEECFACAATCTSCGDACLSEEMVAELRK